jgi:hypothetical protein
VSAVVAASRADIGVIVLEPIGALGFFTRVGHGKEHVSASAERPRNLCISPDAHVNLRAARQRRGKLVSQ